MLIAVDTRRRGAQHGGGGFSSACGSCGRSNSLPRVPTPRLRWMGAERPAARLDLVNLPPVLVVVECPLGSCIPSLDTQYIPNSRHLAGSPRTSSAIRPGPAVGSTLVDVRLRRVLGRTRRLRHACIRSEAQINGGSVLRISAHHVLGGRALSLLVLARLQQEPVTGRQAISDALAAARGLRQRQRLSCGKVVERLVRGRLLDVEMA